MKKIDVFKKMMKKENLLRQVRTGYPLSHLTTMGVGGPCDALVSASDENDLCRTIREAQACGLNYKVIGSGSNIIFRDSGFRGIIIRLQGRTFRQIQVCGDGLLCGASGLSHWILDFCIPRGLGGLEFLAGIPGTLGGMIRTNAGAFSCDIGTYVRKVRVLMPGGEIKWLERGDLDFSYRSLIGFPAGGIITSAVLATEKSTPSLVRSRISGFLEKRRSAQPKGRSSGSIFRNPDGRKAWEVVDAVGMRGYSCGKASISTLHANWILNHGGATSADIRKIVRVVRRKAALKFRIELQTEVEFL